MIAYPNLWFTVIFHCMFWPDYLRVLENSLYQMFAIDVVMMSANLASEIKVM